MSERRDIEGVTPSQMYGVYDKREIERFEEQQKENSRTAQVIKNIQEAVLCHVESLLKDGESIPAEIVELEESVKVPIETGITVTV